MMINRNNQNKMYSTVNLGSLCQLLQVKKLYLACNQYYNHYTDIRDGVKVVERADNRCCSWDNFNNEYTQQNDTYVIAYCRETGVFEYEDTDFPNNNYTDKEYVIMHIIDIDDEHYINKVLSDIDCQNENAKGSIFNKTPIFAKESYLDSLEELDFGEEDFKGQTGV